MRSQRICREDPLLMAGHRNGHYKVFTFKIDSQMATTLSDLQKYFKRQNRADVIRMAISLLNLVKEAEEKNQRLTIEDSQTGANREQLRFLH